MTSESQHDTDSSDRALDRNNRKSDDPGAGSRHSDRLGPNGGRTAAEKPPAHDRQDQSAVEAFGEEGAGIAAKE